MDASTENKPSLKQRAARGAVWIALEMIGIQFSSFVVFAVMAHYIEPRDFGLISICFMALQGLQMMVLYNVGTVVSRKKEGTDLEYTTTFWLMIGFSLLAFVLLLALAPLAERLFTAPGLAPVLRAMSLVMLFMGLSRTHETWLTRHFHFRSMTLRGVAGAVAGGVVGILMAVDGYGVAALVGQQITASLVSLALLWAACPWRPDFRFSRATAAEILDYMRRISGNSFVYAVNQNCDTFLIAAFFGPASAGIYNVGKRVRLTLQLIAGDPIKGITLPTLAEMRDDPERLRRGVLRSLALICAVCSPFFFGASAVAHDAIGLIFGAKWMAAAPVLEWLAFGGLAMVFIAYNDSVFVLEDRPGWCLYVSFSYAVLAIGAALLSLRLHSENLALPFVVPYVAVFPLSAMLVSRRIRLGLRDWAGALLPGLAASTAMYVIVRLLGAQLAGLPALVRLVILCVTGGVMYPLLLWLVSRSTAHMAIDVFRHMIGKAPSPGRNF